MANEITYRLQHMIIGWGAVAIVYFSTGFIHHDNVILLPEIWLDAMIPFSAAGIWLYMAFFILIPFTFLNADIKRIPWLCHSMLASACIAGLTFLIFPTSLNYPTINTSGINGKLLYLLTLIDTEKNCLPSLHGALTALCVWALAARQRPIVTALAAITGLCVLFSIIQLRRHISIDLAAGIVTGLATGCLCLNPSVRAVRFFPHWI